MSRPFRSVRVRIVAAAAVAVGAVLVIAGVALVALVRGSLERPMRGEARARAAEVVAALAANPAATVVPALPAPWPTLVQVVASDGSIDASSAELTGRAALLQISADHREPSGRARLMSNGRMQNWRLDAVAAGASGRPITVVVATSLAQVEQSTRLIVVSLSIGMPALVVVVALFAWILVGRALRPVEALRRQVHDFDHRPGGSRLDPPSTEDEIGRLALTLNELLDRLEQAGAQQHRFVADASHELRSPVANIRAALEVALAHPDAAPWAEVAVDVLGQNERMGRLVDDLLLLARAESGTLVPGDSPVDLVAVVERVRDGAAPRRVPLRLGAVDAAVVRGDSGHLERVIENLVSNAERHASSLVVVSVSVIGRWAQVVVVDDGPGIPADGRERIFQPFVRLDADRSRRGGGTGLGLAIVAEVVAAHGGTVTVGDAHPGAVFTVRLPLAPAQLVSASP